MARAKKKPVKELLLTRSRAADLIGLSARQFDEVIRGRIEAGGRKGRGAKLRYVAAAVVAAFVTYRLEQEVAPAGDDPEGLLAAGGNSPNLERLRRFTADLRERDVRERDKDLLRRQVILNALRPGIAGMRACGDRLVQMYGNDAGALFNHAVNSFAATVEKAIAEQAPEDAVLEK